MKTPITTSEKKPRATRKTKEAEVALSTKCALDKPAAVVPEQAKATVKPTASAQTPATPAAPAALKKTTTTPAKPRKQSKSTEPLIDPPPASPSLPAASREAQAPARPLPSQEAINRMVEEAAYYLAEQRNFAPGFEEEDWLTAKQQIMEQLAKADNPSQ